MKQGDPHGVFRERLMKLTFSLHEVGVSLRGVDAKVSEDFHRELRRIRRDISTASLSELHELADELDELLHAAAVEVMVRVFGTSTYLRIPRFPGGKDIDANWTCNSYVARVRWPEAA